MPERALDSFCLNASNLVRFTVLTVHMYVASGANFHNLDGEVVPLFVPCPDYFSLQKSGH
jgi:hypothetical protein